jgi:NAD-dependent deacetylase sirtuin 5
MASYTPSEFHGPSSDVEEFGRLLASSTRVLALCGAGLSAASGLETFRGAGGMWRNHDAKTLATPQAFRRDPGLVWLFYSYRRHKALQAVPNPGHHALTELSKKMPGFITLTQNVDG